MSQPQSGDNGADARQSGIGACGLARPSVPPGLAVVRRAAEDGYGTVTSNSVDFIALMESTPGHPGLVCLDVAHGLMSLDVQQRLFGCALAQTVGTDLSGRIVRVAFAADRSVRFELHPARTA